MGNGHSSSSSRSSQQGGGSAARGSTPQIRCYNCQGIFTTTQPGQLQHVRCPYCSTINGITSGQAVAGTTAGNSPIAALQAAAASSSNGQLSPASLARQEQLLRRLQAREITPLELLILREFVQHLQENRSGASTQEIDNHTASWVVDDVTKLPEELRSCCVCLEDVCCGNKVRTLPCLHTFHAECAEEWLKKKKVCPLCQFSIDGVQQDGGETEGADAPAELQHG